MAKSENQCLTILTRKIAAWRSDGYNYAANLLTYFINKKGSTDYTPTQADREEVRQRPPETVPGVCKSL